MLAYTLLELFANLKHCVRWSFYALTQQFNTSCKLFGVSKQIVFWHSITSLEHYTTYKRQNQGNSLVYHQIRRICISSKRSFVYHQVAEGYTLMRDDIQPKGLMIYECISRHRRVIHSMIYQVCDLDKKILQKKYPFLQYFLERETGFERLSRAVENPRVRHPAKIKILVQKHEAWSGRRDSNPRYLPWQGSALPLSHSRKFNYGGGGDGTCTRVPTQDYLTFYARSLFTGVAHNRQQAGCFVPRLLGLTK